MLAAPPARSMDVLHCPLWFVPAVSVGIVAAPMKMLSNTTSFASVGTSTLIASTCVPTALTKSSNGSV